MNYAEQKQYTDAESYYLRAIQVYEKSLGSEHQNLATPLINLAHVYLAKGEPQEAEKLYRRVLSIRERELGAENNLTAQTLNDLADTLRQQRRFSEAKPLFERSLAIREKNLGPEHIDTGVSLNSLGVFYAEQGQLENAELFFAQIILSAKGNPDKKSKNLAALALRGLINLHILGKRLDKINDYLDSALNLALDLQTQEPEQAASLRVDVATMKLFQGGYEEAETILNTALMQINGQQAVEIKNKIHFSLATVYMFQRRLKEADALLKDLISAPLNYAENSSSLSTILNSLASLYLQEELYKEAELLAKRAAYLSEKKLVGFEYSYIVSQSLLGRIYQRTGRLDEAEKIFQVALKTSIENHGFDSIMPMGLRAQLSALYRDQNKLELAEELLRESLKFFEKMFGTDTPFMAQLNIELGEIHDRQGRYKEAEERYQKAANIYEKILGETNVETQKLLSKIAKMHKAQGQISEAIFYTIKALNNRNINKSIALSILSEARASGDLDANRAFNLSYQVLQIASNSASAAAVVKVAQRFAAQTDELSGLVRTDQDLILEEDSINKDMISTFSQMQSAENSDRTSKMRERLLEIKKQRDEIQKKLSVNFPEYTMLSRPEPLSVVETQDLLKVDEALVAFNLEEDTSYVWVITNTESFWTQLSTSSKVIEEQIKRLRTSLENPTVTSFDANLSHQIYESIFESINSKLIGKKRISIFANGSLTSIPMGILVTTPPKNTSLKDIDWLIKDYAITVLPSIFSLKTMRSVTSRSKADKPMIAFADPIFSGSRANIASLRSLPSLYRGDEIDVEALAQTLAPLPGTRSEVTAVARQLKVSTSDLFLGIQATETAVKKSNLSNYKIVYFATHGLVSGELERFAKAKAEPALVMTIPSKQTALDDGLLQSSEIAMLKLDADWVILSACNTATSDFIGAESFSGLARSFLYAGARSIVASHWAVQDRATSQLMTNLFSIAKDNPSFTHGEALQRAMLKMLSTAKTEREAHPRLWAPFVVIGEPPPL